MKIILWEHFQNLRNENHTVRTVLKIPHCQNSSKNTTLSEQFQNPNSKIIERDKIDTSSTQIHDRSLDWFWYSLKSGEKDADWHIIVQLLVLLVFKNGRLERFTYDSQKTSSTATSASCLKTDKDRISKINPNLYLMPMIIVLQFQTNRSTRTKVME